MQEPRRYALGYHTCGLPQETPIVEHIATLHELGYEGVELALDRKQLHPHEHGAELFREVRRELERTGLRAVLGVGGRYILSDQRHHPGAVSKEASDRLRWLDFAKQAVTLAGELDCECVMIHSGYSPAGVDGQQAWGWMLEALEALVRLAERADQRLALEWHPDMFVRTAADCERARQQLDSPVLGYTVDVGHAHCTEDEPLGDVIRRLAPHTFHVHLEDMRDRVHKHLPLGQGQIDFVDVFKAFDESCFGGIVALEFTSDVSDGIGLARESLAFLHDNVPRCRAPLAA